MSYGLTPKEFVRQVYYAQEKVILNFEPDDDKYKEVLLEANLVLQELQKEEDWTWLRERLVLGCVDGGDGIPEFCLPDWVYKPSTLHDDCLRLHRVRCDGTICENDYIEVPYASTGSIHRRHQKPFDEWGHIMWRDNDLRCVQIGNVITFNRPLRYLERHNRVAVIDVQRRIELLHVCDDDCVKVDGVCDQIEDVVFTEIPDPNYVVIRTAALHAEGSPPAMARAQSLTDQAQKLLSAMRQNDTSATDSDFLDWDEFGTIEVI